MKTMKSLEHEIEGVERIRVLVRHMNGRDVRSDKTRLPAYPYKRKLKDSATVGYLVETRFRAALPGFIVEVVDERGAKIHGRTLLRTARAAYAGDG